MRFTKAEILGEKTVLTIPDPCQNKEALEAIQEVSRYVLQDPHVCVDSEISNIMETCHDRNNTNVEQLQGGMGDIFAKVATVGE